MTSTGVGIELSIDKTNWKPVCLGDVVEESREVVRDPVKEGIEKVVGLEHIDSESIHLRRWETLEQSTTFTRKFVKGQVLFGRRRAYLKKAALAPFDGICSGDITVLEAKEDLLPELLPFLINNDKFFDFAIKNSAGSLSPRAKFKDLANYEFLLPPKDQQARLAELLWAADEVIEREVKLFDKLSEAFNSEIEYLIHGVSINKKTINQVIEELRVITKLERLENLGTFLKGKGVPKSDVQENGIPCIRYGELYTKHHRIVRRYYSFISKEIASESFRLKKNDVMFAGSGETIEEIGKSAAFVDDIEAYAGSDTLIFRPDNMNGFYLGYSLNSGLVRHQLNKLGTGATVMHIYPSDLKKIIVPKIERAEQDRIAEKLESFELSRKGAKNQIHQSRQLQKSLINQIF
jgi:type I restriction enzyme, S subunit